METLFSRLLSDLRYSARQLSRTPAFTLTAIMTLCLGIGVSAAMFSVIHQVLLRPLPYQRADRIVQMGMRSLSGGSFGSISLPDAQDWIARSHTFEKIGYYSIQFTTVGPADNTRLLPEMLVSPGLLEVLGVKPMLGRGFLPSDSASGANRVILMSAGVWKNTYHGDPSIVGQTIKINGDPYQVIGVMPEDFDFPANVGDEVFAPLPLDNKDMQQRDNAGLQPMGLLRIGVSIDQARQELSSIHAQLLKEYPKEESKDPVAVELYRDALTDRYRPALYALSFAVAAVWLIACANVAGLMLTRAAGRRREIAIRGALGAPRGRLVQQFLADSLVLAFCGGALGLLMAACGLRLLRQYLSSRVLYGDHVHVDAAVLVFLFVFSCLSAILFGVLPGVQASNVAPQQALHDGGKSTGAGKEQRRVHDGFAICQIALTVALLIGAGLSMRALLSLRHTDLGFVPGHVVTGSIYMPQHGIWFTQQPGAPNIVDRFYKPLLEKLRNTPGIESAGLATVRPLMPNWNFTDGIVVNGRPRPDRGNEPEAALRAADAGYFPTFGVRLLRGRMFGAEDTPDSPVSAIVNQAFAKTIFPGEDPLGKQIEIASKGPREWATIVGIVEDVHQHAVGEKPLPELDVNLMQLNPGDDLYAVAGTFLMNVAIKTRLPVGPAEDVLRRSIHEIEPDAAVENLSSMQQVIDYSLGSQTLAARLMGLFGGAALLIACAGIYGLLGYSVSQRTREMGLRFALGARREDVLWMVMRHAFRLLATGAAIGLIMAFIAGSSLRALLYGIGGFDALTTTVMIALIIICGAAASYFPAWRASRVDPMEALRNE